jgi:hypothetical protein
MLVYAPEGVLGQDDEGVTLELRNGQLQMPGADPSHLGVGRFHRYRVSMPFPRPMPRVSPLRETTSDGLRLRLQGQGPPLDEEARVHFETELATRGAAALAPFVLFWLMAPVCLLSGPWVKNLSFPASLMSLLLFYGLLFLSLGFVRRQAQYASVAPWAADGAGLVVGLMMAWAASRR